MIIKLFGWVIILLYQDNLRLDVLQFNYQLNYNCSTSMCSWMAIETIDYFLRNNSEVFICTMDMTKAFDNVNHSKLFQKLLQRDFPPIMIRFLMYVYEIQVATVKWNNCYSMEFNIKNGVKQEQFFLPYSTASTWMTFSAFLEIVVLGAGETENSRAYLAMQITTCCYLPPWMGYSV